MQLLHKLKVRAVDGPDALLKVPPSPPTHPPSLLLCPTAPVQVVRNPVESHLPSGCRRIMTSVTGRLVDVNEFVPGIAGDGKPICIVIGACFALQLQCVARRVTRAGQVL